MAASITPYNPVLRALTVMSVFSGAASRLKLRKNKISVKKIKTVVFSMAVLSSFPANSGVVFCRDV
jgi:hypothetical protein